MSRLAADIKGASSQQKQAAVLRTKKGLMEIIVNKFSEYLRLTDSQLSGDIIFDCQKQYSQIIDQSLNLLLT